MRRVFVLVLDCVGAGHTSTGFPNIYTSADSVFQIPAREGVVPIKTL